MKLFETKKNEIVFELFLHISIIIAKYHCIFKVFVLMQFDPGMEYRPDYRAPGFGMGNKAGGIGSGIPHGLLPQGGGGGGNLMGQHMAGMNQRPGHAMPGILPPPSQQVRSLIFCTSILYIIRFLSRPNSVIDYELSSLSNKIG